MADFGRVQGWLFDNSVCVLPDFIIFQKLIIDQMEYKPFGEVSILNDNVDWKHYYQGGRPDETTGLIPFRFRWYSPELGRWTQQDPIHFAAGDINIYRALGNDPLNGLDPWGLADLDLDWIKQNLKDVNAVLDELVPGMELQRGNDGRLRLHTPEKVDITTNQIGNQIRDKLQKFKDPRKLQLIHGAFLISKRTRAAEIDELIDWNRKPDKGHIDRCKAEKSLGESTEKILNKRGVKIPWGSITAGGLLLFLSEFSQARADGLDIMATSPSFRKAIEALKNNQISRAEDLLWGTSNTGGISSVKADLQNKGYPHTASNFEDDYYRLKQKLQDGQ